MQTQPLSGLLNRDSARVGIRPVADVACLMLQELVNYGTNAWRRCETSAKGKETEDLSTFVLYLHIIEMTDGIEVLLRECCCGPAVPLLRSSFEALVSLQYILECNTTYRKRSLMWFVGYLLDQRRPWNALDPVSPLGHTFRDLQQKDPLLQAFLAALPCETVQAILAQIDGSLDLPDLKDIVEEHRRRGGRRNWYSLYGGPAEFRSLCEHLGAATLFLYESFYRHTSSIAHGTDPDRFLGEPVGDRITYWPLRSAESFVWIGTAAQHFIEAATKAMLGKWRPTETNFGAWHAKVIRPLSQSLANAKIERVEPDQLGASGAR